MFEVLISGKLVRDPQVRVGQSGKPFTTALVRIPIEGEEANLASVIAFGDVGEQLGRLKASSAVCLSGAAKLSSWERDGELRHGLNVTASAILSLHEANKRQGAAPERRSPAAAPQRTAPPATEPEFDDPLPF